MAEDTQATLHGLLRNLEELRSGPDDAIYATKSHFNLLKSLNSLLGSIEEITHTDAERILKMCKMDMQSAPYMLSIKSSLIKFYKTKPFVPAVDFLPSALAVLDFLGNNYNELKANHLRKLSFQVLMSYPQEVLAKLVKDHSSTLIETFGLFLFANAFHAKVESLMLLQLLNCLPAEEKSIFVKQGIPLWLSGVFPKIVKVLISIEDVEKVETYLCYVELLTEEMIKHDYFEYPEWKNFLENVVDRKKFPACILSLLEKGKTTWHRIWIMIIKLLKGYVTKSCGSICTPINSMLPVVETAFKKDSTQRVLAFACWNALIKNFANETQPNCVGKRVRLIIIPLKLNNAKTEEVVTAKFYTWWIFIRKFKHVLAEFDEILTSFLHFLFGKENLTKPTFWAGQVSGGIRNKCLQAFVELLGHSECMASSSRCTNIKPLEGRVATTALFLSHWNNWVYALKSAVMAVTMNYNLESRMYVRCIWKSFVLLLAELSDNSVRTNLFNDLVNLLSAFVEDSATFEDYLEMIIEDLVMPMFSDDRVQTLLISTNQDHRPMHSIVKIITNKTFDNYYKKYEQKALSELLQPLVTRLLSDSLTNPGHMILLLEELPLTDSSLMLWTALVQATPELDLCVQTLSAILKWPFKTMPVFTHVQDAALAWYIVYKAVRAKLDKIDFSEEISKVLIKPVEDSSAANYFILFALIAVLKHKPDDDKMAKLESLLNEMNNCEGFEPVIPSLVETLTLTIDKVPENENLAQITINCLTSILKLLDADAKLNGNDNTLISKEIGVDMAKLNILNKTALFDTIMLALKTYLAKCSNETIKKEIINSISSHEANRKPIIESLKETDVAHKEFASPKVQKLKKNRKTDASIVNTVVENGEEYVVVKSNWKFNPKNLTENQKEKFQRKRDIPALYQDLSQSQDEFKLSTWKTDSQDTSQSSSKSSKSASNYDASEVLKTIPSANIVPKIMENIICSAKNANKTTILPNDGVLKVDKVATPKDTKSPRMALKDRVFLNVRNLIEKSSPSPRIILNDVLLDTVRSPTHKHTDIEITEKIDVRNQTDNVSKSPVPKPKPIVQKGVQKRRHSNNESQTDSQDPCTRPDITVVQVHTSNDENDNNEEGNATNKLNDSYLEKNITSLNKLRKSTLQNVICLKEILTPENQNLEKSSVKCTVINGTKKEPDVVTPSVNKVAKDSQKTTTNLVQNKTHDENFESFTSPISENKELDQPESAVKEKEIQMENKTVEKLVTPKHKIKDIVSKSSIKRTKTSRIEKELMIDMVDGHPILKAQSERRITRKANMEMENRSRRKSLAAKLNKSKLETTPKTTKNPKEKKMSNTLTVEESQDKQTRSMEDSEPPCSEDIIESSQDSTSTTISVKSTKRSPPVPIPQPVVFNSNISIKTISTQDLIQDTEITDIHQQEIHEKTDIELPQNKTVEVDNTTIDLTENMDTEPIGDINVSSDTIVLDNTESAPLIINLGSVVGPETQELAEADTQPNDPGNFIEMEEYEVVGNNQYPGDKNLLRAPNSSVNNLNAERVTLDITQSLPEPAIANIDNAKDVSSPFKDDDIRKQDFLNNTSEISPIKIRSPERQEKSPSPETSSDFFVVKLTSPVHSNGEPFDKVSSPEFFTEDKVSPDKQNASPPRVEIAVTDASPSSLSLKKNRPQGRRAAQMLNLISVNPDLKIKISERAEPEEIRKGANTLARRNLRMLYSCAAQNTDNSAEFNLEEDDEFLKLQRVLPTLTSSPSGPILKRKLVDITDEATASPASKRKRVSFHDPPVSTSVSVQKYIEPLSLIRSPQSSTKKRLERPTPSGTKSPKRLENAFNLDSVLSKTVESFIDIATPTDDTQNTSLDITPVAEIVKTSELNNTDPFYADLIDCKDPIDVIATELSSPAMRDLFVKELEGKVETVGDLAKMTELDINRLCIKAPKLKVAKKVLTDYVAKRSTVQFVETVIEDALSEPMTESLLISKTVDVEIQTDLAQLSSTGIQTVVEPVVCACTQTEGVCVTHTNAQTDESLLLADDFIQKLCENLNEDSVKAFAEKLPTKLLMEFLIKKSDNPTTLLSNIIKLLRKNALADETKSSEMSLLKDLLCERYKARDLHLFCIQILHFIYDKID